ncbi:helix-turn-helix transcriptional regulator [Roseateles toxinivorans]|uniref:Helix-turn-helix protein n=1 Tax=Roseateles toxinivorans TaxID=270368 RepID=A0A4R6QFW2_9BURK|nr:helix-turn-helix transcriptional regulator [Roseateles toxinivorans]TDP61280.1 helix-turn-helix protein [Roseateles toxinivorans]
MNQPEHNLVNLGRSIRAMREQRGLRMQDVAELANTTRFKVGSVEAGDPTVGVYFYAKVAAALGGELQLGIAKRPTLDEIGAILEQDFK